MIGEKIVMRHAMIAQNEKKIRELTARNNELWRQIHELEMEQYRNGAAYDSYVEESDEADRLAMAADPFMKAGKI